MVVTWLGLVSKKIGSNKGFFGGGAPEIPSVCVVLSVHLCSSIQGGFSVPKINKKSV